MVRIGDVVALDENHTRRVRFAEILALARSSHVMGASNDRLHPAQSRIARRADLRCVIFLEWNLRLAIRALVQQQLSVPVSSTNNFALPTNVYEVVVHRNSPLPEREITRALDANSSQQSHPSIHVVAELSDTRGLDCFKVIDQLAFNVVRELARKFY